ncbi:MAG: hypothetical protein COU35_01870 [Candidatus Magasanikbacteria bacterium CG10_big_fil_rev_8_21_14_0_10_47_10]|uniref:Uncharacterized protein n=1 Tax=Candidatus Magasanikbacteria bacterium CG10_big_fil_rev_8_21_14_0_10_47_10 TaxID=1974652 RepID=A0A2H0TQT6_9BACT|nr:MAG: hypothetical protein COU35_01870 [Candidatus Magasanikbacteria bacterium CG10_big_fil_rev_8_21_14_0_10_47_10]
MGPRENIDVLLLPTGIHEGCFLGTHVCFSQADVQAMLDEFGDSLVDPSRMEATKQIGRLPKVSEHPGAYYDGLVGEAYYTYVCNVQHRRWLANPQGNYVYTLRMTNRRTQVAHGLTTFACNRDGGWRSVIVFSQEQHWELLGRWASEQVPGQTVIPIEHLPQTSPHSPMEIVGLTAFVLQCLARSTFGGSMVELRYHSPPLHIPGLQEQMLARRSPPPKRLELPRMLLDNGGNRGLVPVIDEED